MYLKLNILKKRGNKLFFRSTLVVINEQNLHEKNKTKQKPLKSSKMGLNQVKTTNSEVQNNYRESEL